tara:strand:+ start:109 stop:834 length:726 start_codon:yes stop_codon:yes gene_type:complete
MTQVSPDGQWWWDGYGWQPISSKPPSNGQQVSMADSVVAGDLNVVTHHSTNVQVNDEKVIAAAITDVMRCSTCGSNNTSMYDCESLNCGNRFCNVCMQSYMHGNVGISGLFCQSHHQAEADSLGKDDEFSKWEKTMGALLKSYSWKETTKKVLFAFGGILSFIGIAVIPSIPSEGGPMLIMGILLILAGLVYPKIIASTTKNHIGKIPDVNAAIRPQIVNRTLPNYSDESVREFVAGGMVI